MDGGATNQDDTNQLNESRYDLLVQHNTELPSRVSIVSSRFAVPIDLPVLCHECRAYLVNRLALVLSNFSVYHLQNLEMDC